MGNFKVKTDKQTYNQVKSLLLESGFRISAPTGKDWVIGELGGIISSYSNWRDGPPEWFFDIKEITLPDLRDMVVLNRNDHTDANVEEENCLYDLYLTKAGDLYFYHCGKNKWILSNISGDESYYKSLKPIEKTMNTLNTEHHEHPSLKDQYAEIEQVRQASKDNVNNPQHYNKGGVECIDAIEASMTPEAFKGYLKGNVQKYMWRYEQKGGLESLRKAQWYLERLVASMDS